VTRLSGPLSAAIGAGVLVFLAGLAGALRIFDQELRDSNAAGTPPAEPTPSPAVVDLEENWSK
jgi:hypothetical protein